MNEKQVQPWWKFGHMWLVFGGPAIVVVASFITLYLAITRSDPVISDEIHGREAPSVSQQVHSASSLVPAMQARNHAATGAPALSKP